MHPDMMRRALRLDILDMSPQLLEITCAMTWRMLKDTNSVPIRDEDTLDILDKQEGIISTVYGIKRPCDLDHIAAVVHAFAAGGGASR